VPQYDSIAGWVRRQKDSGGTFSYCRGTVCGVACHPITHCRRCARGRGGGPLPFNRKSKI
jgi:hypothetical protein